LDFAASTIRTEEVRFVIDPEVVAPRSANLLAE